MQFTGESEHILGSIVLLLEPSRSMSFSVRDLEAKFGAMVDVPERVVFPEGAGTLFRVPKKRLEMMVMPTKWEINSRGDVVNKDVAKSIADAIYILSGYVENPRWKAIGYNYNVMFAAPDRKVAIETIAASIFVSQDLSQRLGYPVKGAAVWLYLDIEGKDLWLRLEPRGGERDATKVWAYGNFHKDLAGALPQENEVADEFLRLYEIFFAVIGRL